MYSFIFQNTQYFESIPRPEVVWFSAPKDIISTLKSHEFYVRKIQRIKLMLRKLLRSWQIWVSTMGRFINDVSLLSLPPSLYQVWHLMQFFNVVCKQCDNLLTLPCRKLVILVWHHLWTAPINIVTAIGPFYHWNKVDSFSLLNVWSRSECKP